MGEFDHINTTEILEFSLRNDIKEEKRDKEIVRCLFKKA